MIKIPRIFFLLFLSSLISSCVSGKKITYFQNMEELQQEADNLKQSIEIKTNDMLTIIVSAENPESVQPFNLPVVSKPATGEVTMIGGQQQLQTYLVDSEGNIEFPVLGTVNVKGLNRQELSELLEKRISKYVQNPIVNVRIANFQVTVLGEVNRPGTFSIPDENLSLNKALGFAGDLTIYGKRDNVLIIREGNEGKSYEYVDLTNSDLLNSPYYYLKQNDVVYVEPNYAQKQAAAYNRNSSVYISIASIIISLAILFTN